MSLLGSVPCARAYYYCGRCGRGLAPWDRAVGLTARSFTPAAERPVCLAGTLSDGFEEAATKVPPEMASLKVAETTVQRTTEAAGRRAADHLHAGGAFAFPHPWGWHKDALGRTCAYVGIDLTGVRRQAKGGLEEFVRKNFPRDPVLILDFWHAGEYLTELGQLLHPSDEETRRRVVGEWRRTLKREGGARVLEIPEALPASRGPALREKQTAMLSYFRNNVHRMDYPRYVANGWSIGSGAVESACKTIVGQRLKPSGMRWREYGTDAICHLRALFKSETGQWQAFWRRSPPSRAAA